MMRSPIVLLLFLLLSTSQAVSFQLRSGASWEPYITLALKKRSTVKTLASAAHWDSYLTQIYNEADLNRDGSISFNECYERLLLFYIKLNQQAPIPPPDRETVKQLYKTADWNHNRSLNCNEFKHLAATLAGTAYTRLVVHKLVTLFIGPFLATTVVHQFATAEALQGVRSSLSAAAEATLPNSLVGTLQSTSFWKTVFLIFTVSRLGHVVVRTVNWYLDRNKPVASKRLKK
jgi:hypothetical protein